jgi:hypothetical protein
MKPGEGRGVIDVVPGLQPRDLNPISLARSTDWPNTREVLQSIQWNIAMRSLEPD